MKKSLVLAMAMALGVTASAYAANPFSDVPAGHWAYDSINKLAAAGVVEGYGDATFGGDKLMTRYEMAQIVAKAMAKGADVDKLAAEFADELDNLGVKVAALEKKVDNVKVTGNIRYSYADKSGDIDGSTSKLRSRIWVAGQINDDWTYRGMLQNEQDFRNDNGDEKTDFQRAYVEGKLGGVSVAAGRQELVLGDGNIYDTRFDGVILGYGKNVKVEGYYGKPINLNSAFSREAMLQKAADGKDYTFGTKYDEVLGAKVSAKAGKLNAAAAYDVFKGDTTKKIAAADITATSVEADAVDDKTLEDNKIWSVAAGYAFDKNVKLDAIYMHSNLDGVGDDQDGYVVGLNYKGAKAAATGSFGLYAKYYDQASTTIMAHTMNGEYGTNGIKGYMVGANYAFAKNIVGAVEYYDLDGKDAAETNMKTLWSQVVFTF